MWYGHRINYLKENTFTFYTWVINTCKKHYFKVEVLETVATIVLWHILDNNITLWYLPCWPTSTFTFAPVTYSLYLYPLTDRNTQVILNIWLLVPPLQLDTNINDLRYNTGILNDKNSELTNLMATLLPSITTGLKPVAGSLSAPGLGWLGLGLEPLGTSLGLFGTLLLLWVRVWHVFISSSRMSLVWASWRRLSSTLRMSLWEYPNLRNRSTLACCWWWSMLDSVCFLSSVSSGLCGWVILLAYLLWFISVSTATACASEQLTGVKRGRRECQTLSV